VPEAAEDSELKSVVVYFVIVAAILAYLAGFLWLMNRAIMLPVMVNAANPVYSTWWILAWCGYICLGVSLAVAIVFPGREDLK
jgi:hypothetical protein